MKLKKHPRASVRMLFGLLVVCAICARAEKIEKIAVVADSQESNYIQESLADRVYHLIRTAAGQELSDKVLADDIKVLMQSGSFDDVKVERVSLGGDRVGINFIVKPKPVVTNITITGNGVTYLNTTVSLGAGQSYTDCLDYLPVGTYILTLSTADGVIDQYEITVEDDE